MAERVGISPVGSERPLRRILRTAGISLAVGLCVASSERGWTAALWALSLLVFLLVARASSGARPKGRPPLSRILLLGLAAVLPVLVRIAAFDGTRLHGDEFLEAYFSHSHDFSHSNFFSLIPESSEWVARFPKPYSLVQQTFFALFGTDLWTIRLSVQIYVALVSLMLFLIVEELLDRRAAWVAVLLYSFLAPSVYLETLGVRFVSATAAFVVFFYFVLRLDRSQSVFDAAAAGIACGFCYLTYYSSYLAFPFLMAFAVLSLWRTRDRRVLRNVGIASVGVLIVLAPFVVSMLADPDAIVQRARQVSLLTGTWSPHRELIALGKENPLAVIRDSFSQSRRALVQDGIGGSSGYAFGRLALFDGFSLALFAIGSLVGLPLLLRRPELLLVYLVIGVAFFTALVLTIPPPSWHRFSVAFPFVIIVMTIPFWALSRLTGLPRSIRVGLACGLLLLYAVRNEGRLVEAVMGDPPPEELALLQILQQRFGDRKVVIVGNPHAHLQKVFYFWGVPRGWGATPISRRRWQATFHPGGAYAYVVLAGDRYREKFERADPKGRYYRISSFYGIFAN